MPYNYAADIGEGRALSAKPEVFTGLIGEEARLNAQREKYANRPEKLIDWKDFKSDNKDLYPFYARQDAEVTAAGMRKLLQYREQGLSETAAQNTFLMKDAPLIQEQRNQIQKSNENVKTALTNKDIYVDPETKGKLSMLAMNSETTPDQWEKALHDETNGVYAKNGTFGFPQFKDHDFEKDIKDYASKQTSFLDPNEKPTVVPLPNGGWKYTTALHPTREAADAMADEILQDKEKDNLFLKKYGIKVPSTGDPDQDQALIKTEVSKKIFDMFPKSFSDTRTVPPIPESKAEGYNKKTGTGANLRFNVAPVSDGSIGAVLRPNTGNELNQAAEFTYPTALNGDLSSRTFDKNNVSKSWGGKQSGFLDGHVTLTDPETGRKALYFVITKKSQPQGSVSTTIPLDAEGKSKQTTTQKGDTGEQSWLIPVNKQTMAQAVAYANDKKNNNPYSQKLNDDIRAVQAKNEKLNGNKSSVKEEGAFDQGLPTKATKKTKDDPLGLGL